MPEYAEELIVGIINEASLRSVLPNARSAMRPQQARLAS